MAVEPKRGCGYRKVGGIYLCGSGIATPCDRLPYDIDCCPTCGQGVKFTRGITWLDGKTFFNGNCKGVVGYPVGFCHDAGNCEICNSDNLRKVLLLWVGEKYYTPTSLVEEAKRMGISKRVASIPRGLKVGDLILLAHKKAGKKKVEWKEDKKCITCKGEGKIYDFYGTSYGRCNGMRHTEIEVPAIFYAFHLTRIEKLITETQSKDEVTMKELQDKGITPIVVPDNDPDHTTAGEDEK